MQFPKLPFRKNKQTEDTSKNFSFFDLTRAYIIFSIVYLPVSLLFIGKGSLEESILAIYTGIMIILGIVMMWGFILLLASSANDHDGEVGSIVVSYVLNFLIPLITFKGFSYVIVRILPASHSDKFLCDLKKFVLDLYQVYDPQNNLDLIILSSLAIVFVFSLYSVLTKKAN